MIPIISVIVTSYNRELYVAETIQSILASTYKNYELIIVDDCSTDKTQDIIEDYVSKFPQIRYFKNKFNLGEYKNRNLAASYARGKYIKFLDSDDVMSKDCLEIMVLQMEKYSNAAIGLISYFDEKLHERHTIMSPSELYREFYFKGNLINCGPSSTIIRNDVFVIMNGYQTDPYLSDTDFIFRIASKYDAVIFPKHLVFWREHPEQEFNYGILSGAYKRKNYSLFKKYLDECSSPMHKSETKQALRNLKNRYSRSIILKLLRFRFTAAINDLSLYKLNLFDLLLSMNPNKYPEKSII